MKKTSLKQVIFSTSVFLSILSSFNCFAKAADFISNETQETMNEISYLIKKKYISSNVRKTELEHGAFDGMLKSLDPYSAYYNAEDLQNFKKNTDGQFYGIGTEMVLDNVTGGAIITSVIQDSPAYRAGVNVGDIITSIDDVSVIGSKLQVIAKRIRGEQGTSIRVSFYRPITKETFSRQITREAITIENVSAKIYDNKYAVVNIRFFSQKTYDSFIDLINKIMAKHDLEGLILDLRNNPGGLLISAVDIANLFLRDGQIITVVKTREDNKVMDYVARNTTNPFKGIKIAVLVNKGSASASEILAGCLQDHKVATLIGEKTFGKALVQEVFKLNTNEGAVKLTTGQYQTPLNKKINGVGIRPDILVQEAKSNKYDAILQAGLRFLRSKQS